MILFLNLFYFIRKAMEGLPTVDDGIKNAENARHPFRNDP